MKVFVVSRETGQYSGYSSTPIMVFQNEEDAADFCGKLEGIVQEYLIESNDNDWSEKNDTMWTEKYEPRIRELDTGFSHYRNRYDSNGWSITEAEMVNELE